jgi:hypothetical protein
VPPGARPSTDVATSMGRERPRLRLASVAPGPFSGVAHAHVSASVDVLGRACRLSGMLAANQRETDLELNPRRISNLPRFCSSSPAVLHPTFQECSSVHRVRGVGHSLCRYGSGTARHFDCCDKHHGELISRRSGSRFSGSAWRVKGPLRRCAPLTRPARSRSFAITGATADGTSGSIPGWFTKLF